MLKKISSVFIDSAKENRLSIKDMGMSKLVLSNYLPLSSRNGSYILTTLHKIVKGIFVLFI